MSKDEAIAKIKASSRPLTLQLIPPSDDGGVAATAAPAPAPPIATVAPVVVCGGACRTSVRR